MNLRILSNSDLETQLKDLIVQERKLLHLILLHIREVDRRRLYLEKARSSLFEYLVKNMGYSSSGAQRRLEASRLLKDVPALAQKIEQGAVNLSQIGILAQAIKQKERESAKAVSVTDKQDLLSLIENKSSFETQSILAQELDLNLRPLTKTTVQKDESIHLGITLTKNQYNKLLRCKDLAAHILLQNKLGVALPEVIETLCDQFLKGRGVQITTDVSKPYSSDSCTSTSQKRETDSRFQSGTTIPETPPTSLTPLPPQQTELTPKMAAGSVKNAANTTSIKSVKNTKNITPKIKQEILRPHTRCQFQDPKTGDKCQSQFALEVDHKIPRWAGGGHTAENMQGLCAPHNKLKYRKEAQIRFI